MINVRRASETLGHAPQLLKLSHEQPFFDAVLPCKDTFEHVNKCKARGDFRRVLIYDTFIDGRHEAHGSELVNQAVDDVRLNALRFDFDEVKVTGHLQNHAQK